jgi:hypothetical protein
VVAKEARQASSRHPVLNGNPDTHRFGREKRSHDQQTAVAAEAVVVHGGILSLPLLSPTLILSDSNTRIVPAGRMVPIEAGMVREEAHGLQLLGAGVTNVEGRRAQKEQRYQPCQRPVHEEASIGHPKEPGEWSRASGRRSPGRSPQDTRIRPGKSTASSPTCDGGIESPSMRFVADGKQDESHLRPGCVFGKRPLQFKLTGGG